MSDRYETTAAFRAALEQRLVDLSRKQGMSLTRLRKTIVFERFLARLRSVSSDWILTGALAIDFRFPEYSRSTMDIDLVHNQGLDQVREDLVAAGRLDLEDGFAFQVDAVRRLRVDENIRFRVAAELAGRRFDEALVDVALAAPPLWKPEEIDGPGLLSFAGLEPIRIPVLSLEQQVAEKVHAYTRLYGLGVRSSRVKDLVDLLVIARSAELEGARLRFALDATFERRATHVLPASLPPPPSDWERPYSALSSELDLQTPLNEAFSSVGQMVDPVLMGRDSGRWNPDQGSWVD